MTDTGPNLLLELDSERDVSRRRETFLLSVIAHLLVVILIVTQPELFQKALQEVGVTGVPERDVTLLYQPPELPTVEEPPDTPVLSDKNRRAQPGVEAPAPLEYRPPIPPPPPPSPPAPQQGLEERALGDLPPIGIPDFPDLPKEPPEERATIEPVPPPEPASPPSQAQLTLPQIIPPRGGTDAILRGLAKERARGGGGGFDGGYPGYDPRHPNLNLPGPQILSDTMGVDFHPYLLRVLSLVRRNWYAVIPVIARLGRKGRVILQFSILQDGAVPDLTLTDGSGTDSLDVAALASIRLSNPFPALPPEFPGSDIRLQFTYLYNLPLDY